MQGRRVLVLLAAFAFAYPADALAYLDPGAGSLAYQVILGFVFGIALFFRQLRTQIRDWWRRASPPRREPERHPPEPSRPD